MTSVHTHDIGDTVAVDLHTLNGRDPERRNGTVVAVAEDGQVIAEFPQGDLPPMTVAGPPEHFIAVRTTPERFEPATADPRQRLWMHACGWPTAFPAAMTQPEGACYGDPDCDAAPDDWRPLYIRSVTSRPCPSSTSEEDAR
jgi:hypothetical protein